MIDIFAVAGLKKPDISILSEELDFILGFRDLVAIETDPDLEPVRNDPGYELVVRKLKGR